MNFSKKNHEQIKNNTYSVSNKLVLFILVFISLTINAQSPEAFKYQAVVRDGSGNVIASQAVGIQIKILQTSASGTVVYSETFTPTTNNFGLVNLSIGTGTVTSGIFADIDWSNGPYFIETALDPTGGTSYSVTGTSQLLSVPYALYAKNAGSSYWNATTNGIDYADGLTENVGIGTQGTNVNPIVKFQIRTRLADVSSTNLELINDYDQASTYMLFTSNGPDFDHFAIGRNNSASASGANEAFLWQYENFDIKFGTGATEKLRIKDSNGNIEVKAGDVYIENIGSGVIMKSPDGNCWRMTVDNAGSPVFTSITCP